MKPKDLLNRLRQRHLNRTGISMSPADAESMISGALGSVPTPLADGIGITEIRVDYARLGERMGSMPPPASVRGAITTLTAGIRGQIAPFLLDKIGERLAFERTGVRLYDQALVAHTAHGSFDGGPAKDELERLQRQEASHYVLLKEALTELGADATAITPSANVAAVESLGVVLALGDPRRTFADALHAILVAELVDNEGWSTLVTLTDKQGHSELAARFRVASEQEAEHLTLVRRWLAAYHDEAATLGERDEEREAAE